jgi:hypothetical protein
MNRFTSWDVIRKGRVIDTVCYTNDCSAEYVRTTLIDHDGYPSDIIVQYASR